VDNEQQWEEWFNADTDIVKTSRIAELMQALATIHVQRCKHYEAMRVLAKVKDLLDHMREIISRMPAKARTSTLTQADFPSPSGTFICVEQAEIPNEREARILQERLSFKFHELLLKTSICGFKSDPTKREFCIATGAIALKKLMEWEIDYQVICCALHIALSCFLKCALGL